MFHSYCGILAFVRVALNKNTNMAQNRSYHWEPKKKVVGFTRKGAVDVRMFTLISNSL